MFHYYSFLKFQVHLNNEEQYAIIITAIMYSCAILYSSTESGNGILYSLINIVFFCRGNSRVLRVLRDSKLSFPRMDRQLKLS